MQVTPPRPPLTTGFLTVTGRAIEGLVGGYLLLNDRGRPLEFHCTAPVSANRAQEILYGSTLEGYLYGEQIAGSLIRRSRVSVATIFTDLPSVLCVRNQCEYPVSLVKRCTSPTGDVLDDPAASVFVVDGFEMSTSPEHPGDRKRIEACASSVGRWIDLDEPFARIREAINEAQRTQAA